MTWLFNSSLPQCIGFAPRVLVNYFISLLACQDKKVEKHQNCPAISISSVSYAKNGQAQIPYKYYTRTSKDTLFLGHQKQSPLQMIIIPKALLFVDLGNIYSQFRHFLPICMQKDPRSRFFWQKTRRESGEKRMQRRGVSQFSFTSSLPPLSITT